MRFVLDASVAITWALRDEDHPLADLAFDVLGSGSAIVPAVWWYEIRNVLVMNELRGRISRADCMKFLSDLTAFRIEIDPLGHGTEIMDISRRYHLSVYDAAYLELAMREHLPLATLDKAVEASARASAIPLLA